MGSSQCDLAVIALNDATADKKEKADDVIACDNSAVAEPSNPEDNETKSDIKEPMQSAEVVEKYVGEVEILDDTDKLVVQTCEMKLYGQSDEISGETDCKIADDENNNISEFINRTDCQQVEQTINEESKRENTEYLDIDNESAGEVEKQICLPNTAKTADFSNEYESAGCENPGSTSLETEPTGKSGENIKIDEEANLQDPDPETAKLVIAESCSNAEKGSDAAHDETVQGSDDDERPAKLELDLRASEPRSDSGLMVAARDMSDTLSGVLLRITATPPPPTPPPPPAQFDTMPSTTAAPTNQETALPSPPPPPKQKDVVVFSYRDLSSPSPPPVLVQSKGRKKKIG